MNDFMTRFSINCHSSIRCCGDTVLWFDPFRVENTPADGDVIFVTHEHYDHFSPEDIRRVLSPDGAVRLEGTAVGVGEDGGLLVESGGEVIPVTAGEATVRGADGYV